MIRNMKKTSKFMSVLSAIIAVVMLGTTVFASGVLSDLATDDYTIEITNNGEKIELINKPFIENGEVYVPLRETMEKAGFNQNNSNIVWNNGKIYITIAQNGTAGLYGIEIGQAYMGLKHIQPSEIYNTSFNTAEPIMSIGMNNVPILRNSNTYIPIKDINYMLYSFFNVQNEDNSLHELSCNVYDKNGNITSLSEKVTIIEAKDLPYTPEYTIDRFFRNVEIGQIKQAQHYCADWLTSYNDDSEFFQPQKIISDIKIDYTKNSLGEISVEVYTESSNTDIGFIHWKLFLIQTDDNRYLINGYSSVNEVTVDENGNLIEQF